MDSYTDPCSGFVTQDEDGTVCAGFRQCFSNHGINATGFQSWDVPLELRCALDDDLKRWAITPDYLFNVTFYRPVPSLPGIGHCPGLTSLPEISAIANFIER